ncbi:MAG: nucleotidyltransferase domain-containing protein [Bacteroidota bacterium]|uniref:nucleotidyltransferase domain-containing protein n=1 Tax=Hydrotalea lipotrueae TaxID=2803817 RepID=UPI001C496412|nr:nucleotidyltransferase domain-containing protein [Hydrotalea lipotrueae]
MRITQQQAKAIVQQVNAIDAAAAVYLYGSRVNDALKGGDIDIAIVSDNIAIKDKVAIQMNLYDVLEGLKLDILVVDDATMPFWQVVQPSAINLKAYVE